MRYAGLSGEARVERPGRVLVRAARLGAHLRRPALGALGAAIVATAARLLGPLAVRSGIDEGISRGDKGMITRAAVVFLVLLAVQYGAARVSEFAVAWLGERYLRTLRTVVFRHFMGLDMAYYDRAKTGVLVSRMTSDVESLAEFANSGAVTMVTNLLTTVGVAVAMLVVDPALAGLVFVVIGVLVVVTVGFQRQAVRAYRRIRETIGGVLAVLQEGISGVRVVQAFTLEGDQAGAFGRVNERHFEANMSAARAISWYFPLVAFLRVTGVGLVLLVGGHRVIDGSLSFGTLVVFLLYLDWFFQPIINLANVYNLMQSALAGLDKLFGVLDTRPRVTERPGAHDFPSPLQGAVRFESVDFGYGNEAVLEELELDIPAGQRLAVVGETGAGKSTIAKLLLRFYDPGRGRVLVDGHDLTDVTVRSRSDAITLIPQDGFLFAGSLRDNLRYARPDAGDEEIRRVTGLMGLDSWIDGLPEGLDTEVRERGTRFSAGERQLVALARALLAEPAVIVLDEATSNLDPATEVRMEQALTAALAGRTAVVIAHRLRSAEQADRVIMIDQGRIIADGAHDHLVTVSPEYARLVEVWRRGIEG